MTHIFDLMNENEKLFTDKLKLQAKLDIAIKALTLIIHFECGDCNVLATQALEHISGLDKANNLGSNK